MVLPQSCEHLLIVDILTMIHLHHKTKRIVLFLEQGMCMEKFTLNWTRVLRSLGYFA